MAEPTACSAGMTQRRPQRPRGRGAHAHPCRPCCVRCYRNIWTRLRAAAEKRDRAAESTLGEHVSSAGSGKPGCHPGCRRVCRRRRAGPAPLNPVSAPPSQLLVRSVRSTEGSAAKLAQQRSALSTRVDDIQRHALADDAEGQRLLARLDALSLAAASTAIIGPGLTVTVTIPVPARTLSTCPSSESTAAGRSSWIATCSSWSTRCGQRCRGHFGRAVRASDRM